MAHESEQPLIVVGVDGSVRSEPVLRWAATHARAVGGKVLVVTAWRFPEVPGYHPPRVESELSATLERIVDGLVAATMTGVSVRTVVHEDAPARLLLHEAKGADLLVLGSRGHDDDGSPRLGTVTQACLLDAPCPVVVVPVGDAAPAYSG
jgi:nucleotide-binding universal stress UspA family protein